LPGSAWIPFGLWIAVIFAVSSIPDPSPPAVQVPFLDKAAHLGVYGILGALWARARGARGARSVAGAAVGIVIGLADEAYQSTVPGRAVDALDVVADGAGAGLGAWVWQRRRRLRRRS
jgi:VanZ family protein